MKREYEFSKAERSCFFHPEATLNVPLYLDRDVEYSLLVQSA